MKKNSKSVESDLIEVIMDESDHDELMHVQQALQIPNPKWKGFRGVLVNASQSSVAEWCECDLLDNPVANEKFHVQLRHTSSEQMAVAGKYIAITSRMTRIKKPLNVFAHVVCFHDHKSMWLAGIVLESFALDSLSCYAVMLYTGEPIVALAEQTFSIYHQNFVVNDFINSDFVRYFTDNWPNLARFQFVPGQSELIYTKNQWKLTRAVSQSGPLVQFRSTNRKKRYWVFNADPMRIKSINVSLQRGLLGDKRFHEINDHLNHFLRSPKTLTLPVSSSSFSTSNDSRQKFVSNTRSGNHSSFMNAFNSVIKSECGSNEKWIRLARADLEPMNASKKKQRDRESDSRLIHVDFNYYIRSRVLSSPNPLDLIDLRQVNPLAIPLICGWKREVSSYTSSFPVTNAAPESNCIIYITPCGRRIHSYKGLRRYLNQTDSRFEVDQFAFELDVSVLLTSPSLSISCFRYEKDISCGQEPMQVSMVNEVSNDWVDSKFSYISRRFAHDSVPMTTEDQFLACCSCDDDCSDPDTCECQLMTKELCLTLPSLMRSGVWSYRNKRLIDRVTTGIYECNSKCRCKKGCHNRVVQNGLRVRLQVFQTETKGWGVRVLDDVPRGAFVCHYAGVICSNKVANRFGQVGTDIYLTDLDLIDSYEQFKEGCEELYGSMEARSNRDGRAVNVKRTRELFGEQDAYALDGQMYGNVGRFINHSCSPNLFVQSIFVDTHDLRFPWVSFFARETIAAMSELTWDYGYTADTVQDRELNCFCGSTECRGRLL